jgi:hypothetical protein
LGAALQTDGETRSADAASSIRRRSGLGADLKLAGLNTKNRRI